MVDKPGRPVNRIINMNYQMAKRKHLQIDSEFQPGSAYAQQGVTIVNQPQATPLPWRYAPLLQQGFY